MCQIEIYKSMLVVTFLIKAAILDSSNHCVIVVFLYREMIYSFVKRLEQEVL